MDRKKFLKNSALGLGSFLTLPTLISSCKQDDEMIDPTACASSPEETPGPFPIKTPADMIKENIVGDRKGIPLVIEIEVQDTKNNCSPLPNVNVDIWQCDAKGNYSEYDGQLEGDFTTHHFLRGRQTTDSNGKVRFVSIYPGWYPGRAPHIHLEIKNNGGQSLLISQIAFDEAISKTVYATGEYKGAFDTSNSDDGIFEDSLNRNLADKLTGNINDGYVLSKVIKVDGK